MSDVFTAAYDFWFGSLESADDFPVRKSDIWFSASPKVDQYLREHFLAAWENLGEPPVNFGRLPKKEQLGRILLLDQFSRNIFRGTARAFERDHEALALTHILVEQGAKDYYPVEKVFLYLPLEHSENADDQELCVSLFEKLYDEVKPAQKELYRGFLDYAYRHRKVIEAFGRFPHRNVFFGRRSTTEEEAFLKEHPQGF
jgi:uncharacterized protein (DUF924 family)